MKDETLETKMREAAEAVTDRNQRTVMALHPFDATRIAREHAEARARPRDMLIDGLERLLTAYRTGGRPSEATFKNIEKAKAQIAAEQAHAEARREPNGTGD
jgi:hypothetical protein